ncbi:hypothetical protein [Chryseobacterium sp.]|uniref:hypothetical protein n=1 Tax=Chryseobacterium sp. TaxID=1871047 RepID=UPI0025BCE05A|nr:hypothetical protein [Chryseobacterium sp.]
MKKYILSLAAASLFYIPSKACAWYDPDYEYFNLFTQTIIKDKSYLPFLHTYSERFYTAFDHSHIPDENIEAWVKYFHNQLSYPEANYLVTKMNINDLNDLKKGNSNNPLLKKLGNSFYQKYYEGIDYLIEAKYLEPFMAINYIESSDSFYYREKEIDKNATSISYDKTIAALTSLYHAAKNPEIKQRYGYQLVRFNHYTRNYDEAFQAFKKYVEPIQLKGAVYYMALDQFAGVQRGLNMKSDANWNFFQVFMKSKSRKESAFVSMTLSDSASFDNIMKRAGNNEEKNMAYFLLGYSDFTNPIPLMEKMYDIDPGSEVLKVMAARSINELERSYLPTYYYDNNPTSRKKTVDTDPASAQNKAKTETQKQDLSFWQKVVKFFKNLFGGSTADEKSKSNNQADLSDDELLNNPNRLPFYTKNNLYYYSSDDAPIDFLNDLEKFTAKAKEKSTDEYWQIANAYLKFLQKDYKESTEVLNNIKTDNPEYLEEINRMKVLNDIVSQPKITAEFEDQLMAKYSEYFTDKKADQDSTLSRAYSYYDSTPSTADFLKDILANRYFLQGEDGKSFLMNNKLSDLQYNPNSSLVKSVEDFYRKPNKTKFEQQIIAKSIDTVGNIDAFFNIIYGDRAMKLADFEKAKGYYQKTEGFTGIPRFDYDWSHNTNSPKITLAQYEPNQYNGFKNISDLIFGYNIWESYESEATVSMKAEDYSAFPFIKKSMNKFELADALIQLKKIGTGKDEIASKANQLIGNLLYNTSILGYYRQIFVMDIDNSNGGKYDFWNTDKKNPYQYYYKNFTGTPYIEPDNFDLVISYYKKALDHSNNKEQKARILFQMASAEQGKYYQFEVKNPSNIDYSDPQWSEKTKSYDNQMADIKNQKYRTYFTQLKSQYSDTETAQFLMGNCTYFNYFMKR